MSEFIAELLKLENDHRRASGTVIVLKLAEQLWTLLLPHQWIQWTSRCGLI